MKKLSVSGLMLAAFLVGCAAAMVAAPLVVPPVRAGTTPTKWEYKCVSNQTNAAEISAKSSKFGALGFRLATLHHANGRNIMCYERALP